METYTISNEHITAVIKKTGAELISLKTADGHEYLWQGHPDHWTGQSPLLFPIIGGLEDDTYEYKGTTYTMKSHGFARKNDAWEIECRERNSIILNLKDNEATRAIYPFRFKLSLIYTVHDNCLEVEYEVRNLDDKPMPFQIGAHPAFNCPLESTAADGTKALLSDYRVKFNRIENSHTLLKETILTGETAPCLENEDSIELTHEIFDDGALIFRDLKSDEAAYGRKDGEGRSVTMRFPGFTHFAVWKKPKTNAPFICLEPWYGVDSTVGDPKDFMKKEGIVTLAPGELFRAGYSLELR